MSEPTYLDASSILSLLASDPAEHKDGPTILMHLLGCARRVRLDSVVGDGDVLAPENEKRNVGTLTHKLVELYHRGVNPLRFVAQITGHPIIDALLNGPSDNGPAAWPMAAYYQEAFPVGFWGALVGAEIHLERQGLHGRQTGRLDAVWAVDTEAVARIEARFPGVRLCGPGLYGWDLKTAGQRDNNMHEAYLHDPQPFRYLSLLMSTEGGLGCGAGPVRGFLVLKAIRYKTAKQDRFQLVCLPADEVLSVENTKRQSEIERLAKLAMTVDEARPTMCYGYGRMCPHFNTGLCPGY